MRKDFINIFASSVILVHLEVLFADECLVIVGVFHLLVVLVPIELCC